MPASQYQTNEPLPEGLSCTQTVPPLRLVTAEAASGPKHPSTAGVLTPDNLMFSDTPVSIATVNAPATDTCCTSISLRGDSSRCCDDRGNPPNPEGPCRFNISPIWIVRRIWKKRYWVVLIFRQLRWIEMRCEETLGRRILANGIHVERFFALLPAYTGMAGRPINARNRSRDGVR